MTRRADIVLARFPFTDQVGAKLRPVLVLAAVPGAHPDYVVMFISSQRHQAIAGLDVVLEPPSPSFPSTGLKVASVFRIAKVATISDALIVGTMGRLASSVFDDLISRLVRVLRFERESQGQGTGPA